MFTLPERIVGLEVGPDEQRIDKRWLMAYNAALGELAETPHPLFPVCYEWPATRLLRDARSAGDTATNGELMLLHQGAAAFTLWTGQPAPLELMQQRLEAARAGGIRSAEGEPAGDAPEAGAGDAAAAGAAGT